MSFTSVRVRPLCSELAMVAQLELHETPQKLEEGIIYLKDWIAKQPHLRARTDDQWLAAFLRGCKHSLEKTKEKLDLFYTMRSLAPEMTALKCWDPKFKELTKSGYGLFLPKRAHPADPRVAIVRASSYDASKFTPMDIFAVTHAVQLISHMEDDPFVVAGIILIFDFTGLNVIQFKQLTPALIKKAIVHCQDASPIRLKQLHFIGMPSYLQTIFKLCMQVLNDKNKRKIHLHGVEELHKYVSKDILPIEYGGNSGTAQDITDDWVNKIENYGAYFKDDLQFGTDESKRHGSPKTAETLFGVDGSFRQLQFD